MSEEKIQEKIAETIPSLEELKGVMSSINPPQEVAQAPEEQNLITDDALLGVYGELLQYMREDRADASTLQDQFTEMVLNGGDATTSSKEALVNIFKIKTDITDKMAKIADLMTRVKLKEKDTFPRYLNNSSNTTVNIKTANPKRQLLQDIDQAKKKKKEGGK